jgi:hypothetical protein
MKYNYHIYLSYFMFLELEFRSLFHCMSSKGGTILDSAHKHQCRMRQNKIVDPILLSQKKYVPECGLLFHYHVYQNFFRFYQSYILTLYVML